MRAPLLKRGDCPRRHKERDRNGEEARLWIAITTTQVLDFTRKFRRQIEKPRAKAVNVTFALCFSPSLHSNFNCGLLCRPASHGLNAPIPG
jgi:hypothetical protein